MCSSVTTCSPRVFSQAGLADCSTPCPGSHCQSWWWYHACTHPLTKVVFPCVSQSSHRGRRFRTRRGPATQAAAVGPRRNRSRQRRAARGCPPSRAVHPGRAPTAMPRAAVRIKLQCWSCASVYVHVRSKGKHLFKRCRYPCVYASMRSVKLLWARNKHTSRTGVPANAALERQPRGSLDWLSLDWQVCPTAQRRARERPRHAGAAAAMRAWAASGIACRPPAAPAPAPEQAQPHAPSAGMWPGAHAPRIGSVGLRRIGQDRYVD